MKRLKEDRAGGRARHFERVQALGDQLGPGGRAARLGSNPIESRLAEFLVRFRPTTATPSSSAIRPGSSQRSSNSLSRYQRAPPGPVRGQASPRGYRRFADIRLHGPDGAYRGHMTTPRCQAGQRASAAGPKPAATLAAISTMTTADMRHTMPALARHVGVRPLHFAAPALTGHAFDRAVCHVRAAIAATISSHICPPSPRQPPMEIPRARSKQRGGGCVAVAGDVRGDCRRNGRTNVTSRTIDMHGLSRLAHTNLKRPHANMPRKRRALCGAYPLSSLSK